MTQSDWEEDKSFLSKEIEDLVKPNNIGKRWKHLKHYIDSKIM